MPQFTTYDATTLGVLGSYSGSVTSSVVDSAAGPLVLVQAGGTASCPQASPPVPASCVLRIDQHGAMSDAVGVGAAVTLIGPGPAVVVVRHGDRPVRPGAPVLKRGGQRPGGSVKDSGRWIHH